MRTKLFVISDLHLGGKPGEKGAPGFQMCPERNQERLAHFLKTLPRPSDGDEVHLVLAGDIVDFLAEEQFHPFTLDQGEARSKLMTVLERTKVVWDALRGVVKDRVAVTLMLGNHDVEMCLPSVRRSLLEHLGEGRVEFLFDNEAFSFGPVLVEHGNRYDEWNAVAHGALRRVRSQLSRGLPPESFPAMPGSQLVAEVMNELKAEYSWVDLLKPETAGALPILAALGAGGLTDIWKFFKKYRAARETSYGDEREPEEETYIAAREEPGEREASDQAMYDLAQDIAAGGDATQVGAFDFLKGPRDAVGNAVRDARRKALHKALPAFARYDAKTFDMGVESKVYLEPAQAARDRGFQVVVYGHTHLAKNVPLTNGGRYLNTGTWADLMRMPDAVFGKDSEAAGKALDEFVSDLERDEVSSWRRAAPTYALVELEGDEVETADVYFQDESGAEPATTKGLLARLEGDRPIGR